MDGSERGAARPLTATSGRTAPVEELRRHLSSAPPAYLDGALRNPGLTHEEMTLLLLNRSAPAALLAKIGRDRRWTRYHEVRRGIVRHPRTPFAVARSLLGNLYWRDVSEVSEDPRLHPALRRQAELILKDQLPELTPGERITLARRATAGMIAELRQTDDGRVLRAVLGNARSRERDAVAVASRPRVPADVLRWLADHPKWGAQLGVRVALVRNPRTPIAVALRTMAGLPRRELERLADDEEAPRIVRVGAMRRLGTRS